MKFVPTPENLNLDYKESLLLAYSFINSKLLFNPECTFTNKKSRLETTDDFVFARDAFNSHGSKYGQISWYDFYKAHKNDEDIGFFCVAGCDEKDETRITLSFLPKGLENEFPEGNSGIIISVSETLGKKKVQYVVDHIIECFEQSKEKYI